MRPLTSQLFLIFALLNTKQIIVLIRTQFNVSIYSVHCASEHVARDALRKDLLQHQRKVRSQIGMNRRCTDQKARFAFFVFFIKFLGIPIGHSLSPVVRPTNTFAQSSTEGKRI